MVDKMESARIFDSNHKRRPTLKTLEYLGIDTYENLRKTEALRSTLPPEKREVIDYVLKIEEIAKNNAEPYQFHRFIREWINSQHNPAQDRIERFAVLIPTDMPYGAMAFALSVFLSQTEDLSEIARVLRERGFRVFHNRTGIDRIENPYTQLNVFAFEVRDDRIIWILKKLE